nr:hypothetical protein Iba_chr10fCG5140 [Ipomoea batatas]
MSLYGLTLIDLQMKTWHSGSGLRTSFLLALRIWCCVAWRSVASDEYTARCGCAGCAAVNFCY